LEERLGIVVGLAVGVWLGRSDPRRCDYDRSTCNYTTKL
jgi:hypothetical protein